MGTLRLLVFTLLLALGCVSSARADILPPPRPFPPPEPRPRPRLGAEIEYRDAYFGIVVMLVVAGAVFGAIERRGRGRAT